MTSDDLSTGPALTPRQLALPLLLLLAVLIVLLPMAGFFDLYLLPWQSRLIIVRDIDFWSAMKNEPIAYLPFTHFSALPYGPLFYYPTAGWLFVLDLVHLIDLDAWTQLSVASDSMQYTALLKVPNMAIYIAVGLTLLHILPGRAGQDAMLLWLLNPAVILASFVMGQNDSWSMLSILLALLLSSRDLQRGRGVHVGSWRIPHAYLAMVALGAGGAIKLHPLLFVAPFALVLGQSWRDRVLLLSTSAFTFGILILPFSGNTFFREQALMNPQSRDILHRHIGAIPLFYLTYTLATLPAFFRRDAQGLFASIVAIHLLILSLSHWPPERAAWLIGALAAPAAINRVALFTYILTTIAALLRAIMWGNSLGAGAFTLMSAEFARWPPLVQALDRVWSASSFENCVVGLTIAAWSATAVALVVGKTLRVKPVPLIIPLASLSLGIGLFAAAITYGSGGSTLATAGSSPRLATGPLTVEQGIVTGPFSAIDVALERGPATESLVAELQSAPGEGNTVSASSIDWTGRYARLRFAPSTLPGGLYVLRLQVPEGMSFGTLTQRGAHARSNGREVSWIVDYRLHHDAAWSVVADVRARLKYNAGVMAVTALLLAASLAIVGRLTVRRGVSSCPTPPPA